VDKVNALILAGAPAGVELSPDNSEISRAMLPIGDETMLQWVVDALRGSPSVGRIVAVGRVQADGLDEVIAPRDSLVGNMKLGLDALGPSEAVLVASADVPMLTSEAVEDFLTRARQLGADMAYPIIRKADCEARHPELRRTYLKTGDGIFTGGNIMLVRPDFVQRNWQAIQDAYDARKHVAQLARMIGLGTLLRVLIGQAFPRMLRISALENAASRMMGGKVAAVISAYSEIGEDVDKPSDLAAVRAILSS
jgi:2-phospho-L-lactate guanylyltransferase (CobY/MobA/RfbA family)